MSKMDFQTHIQRESRTTSYVILIVILLQETLPNLQTFPKDKSEQAKSNQRPNQLKMKMLFIVVSPKNTSIS